MLAEAGGSLSVLEGGERISFELPAEVDRIESAVPARPPIVRGPLEARALRAEIARARSAGRPYDLVHTAHFPVPRALPIAYTLTVHDLRALSLAGTPIARRLIGRSVIGTAVRRAALVIAVSESVRGELALRFRLDPSRVRLVPNAADHFDPLPRAAGAGAPLVCVGHLEPRKNLELVLRALALDPSLPRLELAGAAKGEEETRLRELARELGVEGRVAFRGAFEERELPGIYGRAACIVLPSRLEGFGIVALEARRARAPLAIARIGSLLEVAGADVPSFSPDDPAECAAAIRAALRTTTEELEDGAREAARWTWDISARAWFEAWCAAARAR